MHFDSNPEPHRGLSDVRHQFTEILIPDSAKRPLADLAAKHGAAYLELPEIEDAAFVAFVDANKWKIDQQQCLRWLYECIGRDATNRYDLEYGTRTSPEVVGWLRANAHWLKVYPEQSALFVEPQYIYWNHLLDAVTFEQLVQPGDILHLESIVEAGCGTGQLVSHLIRHLQVSPASVLGIDISGTAVHGMVEREKCRGFTGTLPDAVAARAIGRDSTDLAFLSYFVDRDCDQLGTFEAAAHIVRPGGKIVLEGLFPVSPLDSTGLRYSTDQKLMIAKGISAEDDISRIVDFMKSLGFEVERIAVGSRMLWSAMDKFEHLGSGYIVLRRKEV